MRDHAKVTLSLHIYIYVFFFSISFLALPPHLQDAYLAM